MKDLEIIKVLDIDNLNICLNIRELVFTKEQGVSRDIEVDCYDCINNNCIHFLIKYKGINVGTIRCLYKENHTVKLQRFCFLKEYRNLGIGKEVLKYIESFYKSLGIKLIKLDSQYQVYKFYEKCGYIKNSDIFMEADIKHIEMIKNI